MSQSASRRGDQVVITNRKARHDYLILDTWECGIVLLGVHAFGHVTNALLIPWNPQTYSGAQFRASIALSTYLAQSVFALCMLCHGMLASFMRRFGLLPTARRHAGLQHRKRARGEIEHLFGFGAHRRADAAQRFVGGQAGPGVGGGGHDGGAGGLEVGVAETSAVAGT